MKCSCPDYSYCCKHLAAVMYGVAARLDKQPDLLFVLRDVDHQELVSQAVAEGNLDRELSGGDDALVGQDLGAIFGIELEAATFPSPARSKAKCKPAPKPLTKKPTAAKKQVATKTAITRTSARTKASVKKILKAATKARGKTATVKPVRKKIAG